MGLELSGAAAALPKRHPKAGAPGLVPHRGATQLQEGLPGGSSCPGSLGHAAAKL